MEISCSLPARCMRCLDMARGAPDLEMNGVKVQVQHMNLFFHSDPVLYSHNPDHDTGIRRCRNLCYYKIIRFYVVFRLN